ncbi:MAG: porin family protein [Gemmatimonadales bacterium]
MQRSLAFITALLLGAAPATAAAQGLGIKGGLSYGNVTNRGVLPGSLQERTGFAAGLAVGSTRSLLGLGVEGLYAQRGVQSANNGASRKLDYIDVPVYLRATFPTPSLAPFAYAGPQVSFEIRCRTGSGACPDTDRPKTSTAAVIGGGVRLGAHSAFTVEGRYVYGLTDLKLSTVTSAENYKTRSFLILAGFEF